MLDVPPAARDVGMVHRDLARFISVAQHDALHAHAKLTPAHVRREFHFPALVHFRSTTPSSNRSTKC
jgi:hypothetical protein